MLQEAKTNYQQSSFSKSMLLVGMCLFLVSCLGDQKTSNTRRKVSSSNTTSTSTKPAPTAPTQTDNLYWYTNTIIQSDFVTVNQNSQTVIYLRGADINNFLAKVGTSGVSNFSKTYCIVAQYNNVTAKKQLRARAVPIGFNDFVTKTYERLLRIDFPEESINSTICDGSVGGYSSSTDIAYTLSTFCPTCSTIIASTSFNLYESVSGAISSTTVVSPLDLDVKPMGVRVDTISGATSGESTCSNSSCSAKGFDCCLNGQCVDDGSLRPGASLLPEYSQAMTDIALNPLRFTQWPTVFYICTNITNPDPTPVPGTDPNPAANEAFEKLKKEYYCLEEGKKETPDYSIGACSDTKYLTKLTCEANGKCNSATYTTKVTCEAGGKIWTPHAWTYHCFPTGSITDHNTIRSDVWSRCGCSADPFPAEPEEPLCPDYGLRAVTDANDNILEVMCYFPAPETDPQPFQELEISLSARSAPHRFYLKDIGTPVDDVSTFNFLTLVPELEDALPEFEAFSYIDESSKLEPVGGENFNPNAIIGQLSIDLSQARPAHKIDVEIDQTYIIMTTQGAYTPCPQCAKDSWFSAFSPFPNSLNGRGLEAVGHTTERDNYSTNITLGNYEDTIFGRACFVPLTMLPYSHRPQSSNLINQRKDRLSAQTAMWVNGYQRDWFGFNHGAVIGSFDGVKWFAVGGGRRVIATTKKLYLAINAPFADLADPTQFTISITTEDGNNFAADHDFDPELSTIDARNNAGASCQRYHQCETDSDCVTQLGWEYMCANVSSFKTYIPSFGSESTERNLSITSSGFSKVLQSGTPPGTNKRCVYRGAGAPCIRDYTDTNTIFSADSTMDRKRLFMCAPNFTCQELDDATFNDQVVREPNNLFSVLYGKDADVLGRPKNYIRGTKTLPATAITNLIENLSLYHKNYSTGTRFSQTQVGLCRPGKSTGFSSYLDQHRNGDNSLRADFVSQVGSCDPAESGQTRTRSCPVFDMDRFDDADETEPNKDYGNYLFPTSSDNNDEKQQQNMCGKSAQNISKVSAFASIELTASPSNFLSPALAEHACLRRAGSFCHTDLDCGPNKMHAEVVDQFDLNYFGGTNAEKKYWTEYLVCGQAEPLPFLSSNQFNSYKLSENRCCREIGNELTMYTTLSTSTGTIQLDGDLKQLVTSLRTSVGPHVDGRYSRYEDVNFSTSTSGIANDSTDKLIPLVNVDSVPSPSFQWRTFQKTGRNSCCGGGFVRKFADGSHDWSKRDRFKFDPRNFACLNFKSELPLPYFGGHWGEQKTDIMERIFDDDADIFRLMQTNWGNDVSSYCTTPQVGNQPDSISTYGRGVGCANLEIPEVDEDNKYALTPPDGTKSSGNVRIQFFPSNNYFGSDSGSGSGSGSSSNSPITMRHVFPEAPFFPNEWNYTPKVFPSTTVIVDDFFTDDIIQSWADSLVPWTFTSDGTDGGSGNYLASFSFFWPSYLPFPNTGGANPENVERATVHFFTAGSDSQYCEDGTFKSGSSFEYTNGSLNSATSFISGHMDGFEVDLPLPLAECPATITPLASLASTSEPYLITASTGMNGVAYLGSNAQAEAAWCYIDDPVRGMIVVVALPQRDDDPITDDDCTVATDDSFPWQWAGLEIEFTPPNTEDYEYGDGNTDTDHMGMFPGNALYYLSKLGRYELLGIPQIFSEPIMCNANRDTVLPGLFSDSIKTRANTASGSNGFGSFFDTINEANGFMQIYDSNADSAADAGNPNDTAIYFAAHEENFDNEAIFSENEFLCCAKLGTSTTSIDNCCSGHGIADPTDNTRFQCKLPRGANLNVFFNRFVSSEGLLADLPEDTEEDDKIGFKDSHFIPETGEIKFSDEAYDTLIALGQQHCESGTVRPGGALGRYFGEPNRGIFFNSDDPDSELQDGADPEAAKFGFADSPRDFDSTSGDFPTGYAVFLAGYRWNHHYYCD